MLCGMKRDGRTLAHNTLEEMRGLAVQRMKDGEHPEVVAASFGMNRSWAYKCRSLAQGRGRGVRVLRSTKGTGRPRKLTEAQERQVFRDQRVHAQANLLAPLLIVPVQPGV